MARIMNKYFDRNGNPITKGCTIRYTDENGTPVLKRDGSEDRDLIYEVGDDYLGVNASNPAYLRNHPEAVQEFYPLDEFPHAYDAKTLTYTMLEMEVVES